MIVGDGLIQPAPLLLAAAAVLALLAGGWWIREYRLGAQRRAMRALHALSEDIIAASSPAEIAEILAARLPEATRATSSICILFNLRSKVLERVPTAADPEPMAAPVDSPPEGLASAAVVCFRNRTQLNIPDVRRSPLVKDRSENEPAARGPVHAPHGAERDAGAKRGAWRPGGPQRPQVGLLQAGGTSRGTSSGQPGRGVAETPGPARDARATVPQRETGRHRTTHLGRRQRSARSPGQHRSVDGVAVGVRRRARYRKRTCSVYPPKPIAHPKSCGAWYPSRARTSPRPSA